MPQSINLKHKGLYTWPNPLSGIPEGALEIAKNLVIDREETAEPRRGYSELSYPLGVDTSNIADQLINFGDFELLAHYGTAGSPNKLAFFMFVQDFTGVITSGSNVIDDISSTSGFYSSAIVKGTEKQTIFLANQTLGSNTLTDILSTQGLFVGQEIGGRGIPENTTISAISGTGPYTITMSDNALFTGVGNTITATNKNLNNFSTNTRAVVINGDNVVLDGNASYTSRTLSFNPSDVTTLTDTIAIANHGLTDGQEIQLTTTGTLPSPLATSTVYYIVQSANGTFKLSTTSVKP
jgi:hypothetical protein